MISLDKNSAIIISIISIFLLSLALNPAAFTDSDPEKGPIMSLEPVKKLVFRRGQLRKPVRLKIASFDPLRKRPTFRKGWSYSFKRRMEGQYIVQLDGSVKSEEKSKIKEIGADIISYIPDYAFLVRAKPSTKREISSLSFVRWVGVYQPAYKISKNLLESQGTESVVIITFPNADPGQVASELNKNGIKNRKPVSLPSGSLISAQADPNQFSKIAQIKGVRRIEKYSQPQALNDGARWVIQSRRQNYTPIHDNGIRGENQIIAVADTGLLVNTENQPSHEMFYDSDDNVGLSHRKILSYYVPQGAGGKIGDEQGHGTHVAGSVAGDNTPYGVYGGFDGQAFKAKIEMQDIDNDSSNDLYPPADLTNLFQPAYENGARIHNNSWGGGYGYGYTTYSQTIDNFMWQHKNFQAIFAMGNDGPDNQSLSTNAEAKNAISVGATWNRASAENIPGFSSRGPAEDNRIKPTIMAPGIRVYSSYNGDNDDYVGLGGTSMASPTVAGGLALIRQYFDNGWYPLGIPSPRNSFEPSSALLRATLLAGATEIEGENSHLYDNYPNPSQGWGLMNLDNSLFFENDDRNMIVVENRAGLKTGENWTHQVDIIDNSISAKFILAWTDYPGDSTALNQLVNNLNLKITDPSGDNYWGNNFENSVPSFSTTGGAPDNKNVGEIVLFRPDNNHYEEGTYTVKVSGANIPMGESPNNTQPFAFVATGGIFEPPTLLDPPNNSNLSDNIPHFKWSNVCGADNYQLQYSTDNTFNTDLVSHENIRDDNYLIAAENSLKDGHYYWRVRAGDEEGNLSSWSDDYSITIDTVQPLAPSLSSPSDGTLDNVNSQTLEWSESSDSTSGVDNYRVYVDGSEVDEVDNTENTYTHYFSEGSHAWHVGAVDYAGNENESGSWSITVDNTAPPKPTLQSPDNNSTVNNCIPTFGWENISDPSGITYRLVIDNKSSFSSPLYDKSGISDNTHASENSLPQDNLYWKVRARDGAGNSGEWADWYKVEVSPIGPTLKSPENNSSENDRTPLFEWIPDLTNDDQITIRIDDDSSLSSPLYENNLGTGDPENHSLPDDNALTEGVYYWEVEEATDGASTIWSFRIDRTQPPSPGLISPENEINDNSKTRTLIWENLDPSENSVPVSYHIQIDNNSSFSSPERENFWQTNNSYSTTLQDDLWYWRVRGRDNAGNAGPWSGAREMRVDTVSPPAPSLSNPTDGNTVSNATQTFDWENIRMQENSVPVMYHFQVATDNAFDNIYHETSWLMDNAYTYNLENNDNYYWRVRCRDNAGNVGSWGDNFKLAIISPPSKPTLTSPKDGSQENENNLTLEWTPANNADNHRVLVDNNENFNSPAENVLLGATDDNYATTTLSDDIYYWKIVASNVAGENGSENHSFIIDTVYPTITRVGASNIDQESATIQWTTDEPADSKVEYGTSTTYGSTPTKSGLRTDHYLDLSGLSPGTTYHYRVKSADEAGNETVSPDHTFTTSSPPSKTSTAPSRPSPNEPPIADANGPYSVDSGSYVVLRGWGSNDPDGGIKSYTWTIENDPTGKVELENASSQEPIFRAPVLDSETEVTVRLVVEDYRGGSDVDHSKVAIKVSPKAPSPIELENLHIENDVIELGEKNKISIDVTNSGDFKKSYRVTLAMNGENFESKAVEVGPGATKKVSFDVQVEKEGVYNISFGNKSGSFEVGGTKKKPSLPLIPGIVIGIILTIVVIAFYFR